ncbi:DUF4330 domain-containing protein [Paramaledivibacter caminithermalis]|uniref:DUF4330 domain-containing protein n=1 Tax=Paramaledivibacter caminithermalis (strain DSM 15212 / CIP 107654 / DViRD3) TaxID=1121301 RepID=A0A1M6KSL8_PARC5|nr:DUF4330 domain-containing protein [Paramaledivibacter caminithermalis]SHJ61939.1 protein of unknown function [Paramaledivibacter caminithermalis DSM 15212]
MKIIDEKGRIFGLINYLDLMVLLIVALLAGKFFVLDNDENAKELLQSQSNKEILLTYYIKGIKEISVNSVKEGDVFRDVETGSILGEVVKKEVANSQIQTTDTEGNVIYSIIPDRYDLILTLKSKGNVTETDRDIKVSNVDVQIGRSMLIESKLIRFMAVIYGIE